MSTIRWLHSEIPGSPGRFTSNGFSSFTSIFDAFLVNGFAQQTPVSISVSSGVCTATFSTPGLFPQFSVVRVAGADDPAVNGDFVVTSASGTSITFNTPGASDGSVSGSISVRMAPIGWTKPFSDSSDVVYRPASYYAGNPYFYRISSAGSGSARYILVADATSTLSGTTLASGSILFATSWSNAAWLVVGNGSTYYMLINTGSTSNSSYPLIGGALISHGAGAPVTSSDAFLSVISFVDPPQLDTPINNGSNISYCGPLGAGSSNFKAARTINGVTPGPNLAFTMESLYPGSPALSGNFSGGVAFPNSGNNALILSRIALYENFSLRGFLPGVYVSPQNCASFYNMLQIVDGTGSLAGRKLLAVRCGTMSFSTTSPGIVFFDITGPWSYTP